ncbi:DUF4212 domain-containing protein [Halospeciosus flavus]|uniref:DUF4212 domain-containing protein n=1 Tax=Halospeciosus flavus TaxID=3032283 RepID=A0ABD5Z802_9EURY|nr:DUF4212 domain-containing protein [Halospeciosus flavus]
MTDNDRAESSDDSRAVPDGGVASASQRHQDTDYLQEEVNLLKPSTPFMRDHLRIIWTGFAIWAVIVFGPVTLTKLAPGVMTTPIPVLEFPLHYFLMAIVAPTGGLLLSLWYVRKRDALDEKYGIAHGGESE